ncbi:phage holin, lambda family [Celerinatantimonas diazotrophica]|uniref:Lambda family phage holin n=1 Tax=Celerinatantimonas diazotrophica TaxID=412034 RepID=A0A4V2PNB7_9GAMM|nr:phage holin, lambda family [Celerinatantimonas diazotrophica]TCK46438.1 lambda family phage holin [Celerinatantimonas diazotrophica]CAG9295185.1 hypothetical protein CEDIAZO_00297 [Celerinatantimonas diazotrophica]
MDINTLYSFFKGLLKGDSILFSLFISIFMAALRIIYSGGSFLEIILEGMLCGCLTLIAVSLINFMGVSSHLTVSIGGFIGFMGVKKINYWINKIISKNLP